MPAPQLYEPGIQRYRADIDGLRAAAVVAVILFHYRIPGFAGGFAGVDVFFVISGYLITGLVQGELDRGSFTFAGFYERRIRRIFPALFAMLALASVAAALLLFPMDLQDFGHSLRAAALSSSNFYFWRRVDYFDFGSNLQPLLHTWSLGVEEQFYIVYPLLLWGLRRFSRARRGAVLSLCAMLSLVLFLYATAVHPQAAFFLSVARAWEMLAGALVTLLPAPRDGAWREACGSGGLALLVTAFVLPLPRDVIINWSVLAGCAAAAMLIHAGAEGHARVSRFLSLKPLVFVGLLSYSLYLWHWPLLIYLQYFAGAFPPFGVRIGALLCCFLLAWLSWRFIERPFRLGHGLMPRITLFGAAMAAVLVAVVGSIGLAACDGWPGRYPRGLGNMLVQSSRFEPYWGNCFKTLTVARLKAGDVCTFGNPAVPVSVALWGDSHAAAILPGIAAEAERHGRRVAFVGLAGCAPLLWEMRTDAPDPHCPQFNALMLDWLRKTNIHKVVMVARWHMHQTETLRDTRVGSNGRDDPHRLFVRLLDDTVAELRRRGIQVIIVADVPNPGQSVPLSLARHAVFGRPIIPLTLTARNAIDKYDLAEFGRLAATHQVQLLDPATILCSHGLCAIENDEGPFYRDGNHLSVLGASQLEPLFDGVFASAQ